MRFLTEKIHKVSGGQTGSVILLLKIALQEGGCRLRY